MLHLSRLTGRPPTAPCRGRFWTPCRGHQLGLVSLGLLLSVGLFRSAASAARPPVGMFPPQLSQVLLVTNLEPVAADATATADAEPSPPLPERLAAPKPLPEPPSPSKPAVSPSAPTPAAPRPAASNPSPTPARNDAANPAPSWPCGSASAAAPTYNPGYYPGYYPGSYPGYSAAGAWGPARYPTWPRPMGPLPPSACCGPSCGCSTAGCGGCGGPPQPLSPAAPCPVRAVDGSQCGGGCGGHCRSWEAARFINWQAYAQGEYVGHDRLVHVSEYRLRVDDQLDTIYRVTRDETPDPYKLNVGDELRVESFTDADLNRDLIVQPDGAITMRLLGQVHATGLTIPELRDKLEELYKKLYRVPAITVLPLKMNTKLEDLRATVDRRQGVGGQSQLVRVTPEGTIALPAIGSVCAQGLTLPELQLELNERYRNVVAGMEVIPVLAQRATRYVYVLGEVRVPGRFSLEGPTTVMQAISMGGGWNVGANLRQVVIFRRGDDWRLMATMVNLQAALYGHEPNPSGELWVSDSDVIIVPKGTILLADEFISLVFTHGLYGVVPTSGLTFTFTKLSTL